jgi:hypothetical protein
VERGYLTDNPVDLIQHPRVEERVIPIIMGLLVHNAFSVATAVAELDSDAANVSEFIERYGLDELFGSEPETL